jgi:hypothetical protein
MHTTFKFWPIALAALSVSGCAVFQPPSVPLGASTEQAEAIMGKPVDVVAAPNGDTVWQYPTGYYGEYTYLVTLGADRRVKAFSQARTWENFARIRQGMSRAEIRLMFGAPYEVVTYRNLREEVWSYRYLIPVADGRIFNVHFDAGTGLVRTTSDERDPVYHQIFSAP